MASIEELRKARLEQALKDMGNYGVKLRKPEDLPDFDQPIYYEEEKRKFEPVKVEEPNEKESPVEYSLTTCQETELSSTEELVSAGEPQRREGKVKSRERLADFLGKYLQPIHVNHRKAVYVSEDTQKRMGYVVRKIGEQGASISGYVEQVLREHLDQYKDDV